MDSGLVEFWTIAAQWAWRHLAVPGRRGKGRCPRERNPAFAIAGSEGFCPRIPSLRYGTSPRPTCAGYFRHLEKARAGLIWAKILRWNPW